MEYFTFKNIPTGVLTIFTSQVLVVGAIEIFIQVSTPSYSRPLSDPFARRFLRVFSPSMGISAAFVAAVCAVEKFREHRQ